MIIIGNDAQNQSNPPPVDVVVINYPVQDIGLVTISGTNWVDEKTILTRSFLVDNISSEKCVHYRVECIGEVVGNITGSKLNAQLGVFGLFKGYDQYAMLDSYTVSTEVTSGFAEQIKVSNPNNQTNQIMVDILASIDGAVRVKCVFNLSFTLPFGADLAINPPDWK